MDKHSFHILCRAIVRNFNPRMPHIKDLKIVRVLGNCSLEISRKFTGAIVQELKISREQGTRDIRSNDNSAVILLHRRFQQKTKALECCCVKRGKSRNKVFLTIWGLVPKSHPTASRLTLSTKFDVQMESNLNCPFGRL